ncbi:hypothetical protein [Thalassotalea maritima]|uniref:hypothetical protein n=1 Tax=Thalassotalea maritima TaxID=3242416 RepID=UPI0035292B53
MRIFVWLLVVVLSKNSFALALEELSEQDINHIAQQVINYHKTEDPRLLREILSSQLAVTVSQGSDYVGFKVHYDRQEYLTYLAKGHKSTTRRGTDAKVISTEYLGNKEAKIIIRYRSKRLNRYVWMEAIVGLENNQAKIIEIDEFN